jgi:LCP family protein required for cell wall assembly
MSSTRRLRRRSPAPVALLLALVVGVVGSIGVLRAAEETTNKVSRVKGLEKVLTEPTNDGPAENFLLVGSDSREGVDPGDASLGEVAGQRSDTIMLLRREKNGGAALMSLPRDLWVEIPGKGEGKINGAYSGGPQLLAKTITETFGIPVHHYVEVDLAGFKRVVDAVDGVRICFLFATRDTNSGLNQQPGCHKLDGTQALAYARSRHYEEFRDGDWQEDPRADLGRIERQQHFIREAVNQALKTMKNDPFSANRLINAVLKGVSIDEGLEPINAANALRAAAEEGLVTLTLPVFGDTEGDQAVLRLGEGAEDVLDYFRGKAPLPEVSATTEPEE